MKNLKGQSSPLVDIVELRCRNRSDKYTLYSDHTLKVMSQDNPGNCKILRQARVVSWEPTMHIKRGSGHASQTTARNEFSCDWTKHLFPNIFRLELEGDQTKCLKRMTFAHALPPSASEMKWIQSTNLKRIKLYNFHQSLKFCINLWGMIPRGERVNVYLVQFKFETLTNKRIIFPTGIVNWLSDGHSISRQWIVNHSRKRLRNNRLSLLAIPCITNVLVCRVGHDMRRNCF